MTQDDHFDDRKELWNDVFNSRVSLESFIRDMCRGTK